jgi:TatD DNase family protein
MLIDTHSHQYAEEFNEDLPSVIQRCKTNGLMQILLPNIDSNSHKAMMSLATAYPNYCLPMMGLHPCSVKEESYRSELDFVAAELKAGSYIGVGEMGMDLYWDTSTKKIQEEALLFQCELAIEHDLPIVLHTRNATRTVLDLLQHHQFKGLKGVFHCFGDGLIEAKEIIDLGFYLGIGGVVTFKNSGLDKTLLDVSLNNIVLETDSPYLAPVPFRGKRNESSYLLNIAQKLADIKGVSIEELGRITSQNAIDLFRLKGLVV